jgi:putative ABC transport system substrate-binding protein
MFSAYGGPVQRRSFLTLLGGAAAAWPLAAGAQQDGRVRRIGVLMGGTEDPMALAAIAALREELAKRGWVEGRNLQMQVRFGGGDVDRFRTLSAELVSLAPDVIVCQTGAATRALQQQTQTIPIVITGAGDPAGTGFVKNIARPEGNTTGITNLYASIGGKWLELLKEIAPRVTRVGLIYNDRIDIIDSVYEPWIEQAALTLGATTFKVLDRDALDIVRALDAFATEPNGGLIIMPPGPTAPNRETIFRLAANHKLPTIGSEKSYVAEGALLSYGSDAVDRYRRAAAYVDRLLRGAKVIDQPIQFPTRFELLINLKTAKAIGLSVSESFLVRADEVIE